MTEAFEATDRKAALPLLVQDFLADESGQDLIEYGLVAVLVSLCAIISMQGVATKISALLNLVANGLNSAV